MSPSAAAPTASVRNTSDRPVVLTARDPESPGRYKNFVIPPGGTATMLEADAVASAQNRDYLVAAAAADQLVEPVIAGVALGPLVGHSVIPAGDVEAGTPTDPAVTVVSDQHTHETASRRAQTKRAAAGNVEAATPASPAGGDEEEG